MMMAIFRLTCLRLHLCGSIHPRNFSRPAGHGSDMFEAVGKHSVGEMSDADLY